MWLHSLLLYYAAIYIYIYIYNTYIYVCACVCVCVSAYPFTLVRGVSKSFVVGAATWISRYHFACCGLTVTAVYYMVSSHGGYWTHTWLHSLWEAKGRSHRTHDKPYTCLKGQNSHQIIQNYIVLFSGKFRKTYELWDRELMGNSKNQFTTSIVYTVNCHCSWANLINCTLLLHRY